MPHSILISQRAKALKPSLTLEISSIAKALKAEGKDICSLSAGEPDFDTPSFIIEATFKALKDGLTRYGPAAGDPELREAIAEKITEMNKLPVTTENVLVTNGGKQAIYNLFQVTLNPGDEVIIPSPYWLSYPEMVRLAGGNPIILESSLSNGFQLDVAQLEESITDKTKFIIINSPGNPTGRVMPRKELESIASLLRKYPKISVVSDEIYEYLVAEGITQVTFTEVAPDLNDRVFIVNGFAKSWAMTGWRVGYLVGHPKVIKAAISLQSQSTSNVCSFAQRGAIAALKGSKDCVKEMVEKYNRRRNLLVSGLNDIKDISLITPNGAFYAFPQLPDSCVGSIEFCRIALEKEGLAMVPGMAFGEDRCIRISCAASSSTIINGLNRLRRLL